MTTRSIRMAPRTRSTTSSPVKKSSLMLTTTADDEHDSVKILIAPHCISSTTRIISLRHPCNGPRKNFFFCAQNGLFELKKTTVPSTDTRSVIFAPLTSPNSNGPAFVEPNDDSFSDGFINKDAELLTATPFDLAYIFVGMIAPQSVATKKSLFQPVEDLLDALESNDNSIEYILQVGEGLVKDAMSKICDKVEAGEEEMFRYNEEKVFNIVLERAQQIAQSGLPASLEDRYVTRVLEAPMLSIRREETTISVSAPQQTALEDNTSQGESLGSQSTTSSAAVSAVFSEASITTKVSSVPEDNVPIKVKYLQRLRVAFSFIGATCLPGFVTARLTALLSGTSSTVDFQPLEAYLKNLAALRAEATASRQMSDFSRKRGLADEEAAEEKAEKKRKQEEDEKKRKANESRGVRDLKKVNVSGMKKMSDFFAKKPGTAKVKT